MLLKRSLQDVREPRMRGDDPDYEFLEDGTL